VTHCNWQHPLRRAELMKCLLESTLNN